MRAKCHSLDARPKRGLVLPVVLILLAGLWLLALSTLTLVSVGQKSRGVRLDGVQADLALQAAMADVMSSLNSACDNDDYLVVGDDAGVARRASRLYLVTPSIESGELRYAYRALHSALGEGVADQKLLSRPAKGKEGAAALQIHPWLDPVRVDWIPMHDGEGRAVARYAYWVEDLEAKLDPSLSGLQSEGPVRLQAMDESRNHQSSRRLLNARNVMISPDSSLAAAGVRPPLQRWKRSESREFAGRLIDPWEAFVEAHTHVGLQPYEEQARVPYVRGVSALVMGQPKRNLNRLLQQERHRCVQEMASWMATALPGFEQRGGGFPEDYLQTLAAGALDYADEDATPTIMAGRYRGVDGQPFLSELVLHLHFQGLVREEQRWVLRWTLRLFAELWNMSSKPIEAGEARLSYEVNLRPTPVGLGDLGLPFDSAKLLDDPRQSRHQLQKVDGRYLTPPIKLELRPDEYRFFEFAKVDYRIDCRPQLDSSGLPMAEWFDLVEPEHEARGLSLLWNDRVVERLQRIHRDPYGLANFRTDRSRKTAKACIPGLNYGAYGSMVNNLGDPRMSHYLRGMPLGENAYPENLSPHRRNIRRRNIYDRDPSPFKVRHYGRVMPSQWPDGGHDSATGDFRVTTSDARFPTDPEFWPLSQVPTPNAAHSPQSLSNRGRFMSVTELGRVFDPLMWTPAYPDLEDQAGSGARDTDELTGRLSFWHRPSMPLRRDGWPEVSWNSLPSRSHGGGNSLRVGRPEHARFDEPGMRASHLVDLFHCGRADSDDPLLRQGPLQYVAGRINLNTASRDVLRCIAYGALEEDEAIARVIDKRHDIRHALGPQLEPWRPTEAQLDDVAARLADAIIRERPFASLSEVANIRDGAGDPVFGHPNLHEDRDSLQWSDAAAEELFARVHEVGGLRSRNFRVWMVGQRIRAREGGESEFEVTAQSKRVADLFVDPGQRNAQGELIGRNLKVKVLHVRNF